VYDAFMVHVRKPDGTNITNDPATPRLDAYATPDLWKDCQGNSPPNGEEIETCDERSLTIKNARNRYLNTTSLGALACTVGYQNSDLFENDLISNKAVAPPTYTSEGPKWWGIPIHRSRQLKSATSLSHWEQNYVLRHRKPEQLFGPECHGLSKKYPPLYTNSDFLDTTYGRSGYGTGTIAALWTLGYRVEGIAPLPPLEGTVVTFDGNQETFKKMMDESRQLLQKQIEELEEQSEQKKQEGKEQQAQKEKQKEQEDASLTI
jgi:hypothetical protein